MKLSTQQITDFQATVWQYFDQHARSMPWRSESSFYYVLVSELMLQQTQVSRVMPKFEAFVRRFPTIDGLAAAQLADVIVAWQGLGYNRRAKYLHDAAQHIVRHGRPTTEQTLQTLPGVGANTAGAIMAYAYNQPVVFVETNIRTVYIATFFADVDQVHDRDIIDCVRQTLDHSNPREWYYALMDYGAHLKQSDARVSQSKHYRKQPALQGSIREMRGKILRVLVQGALDRRELEQLLDHDTRVSRAIDGLVRDGLVEMVGEQISLTASREPS